MNTDDYLFEAAKVGYNTAIARNVLLTAPSTIYKPKLSIDGDQWCALYGENLQDGVAGFGNSPAEAYSDFDKNWVTDLPHKER